MRAAVQLPRIAVFSKPIDNLSHADLAKAIRSAGVDAADLTVRRNGHVQPLRVEQDLSRAVEVLREHGVAVPMISTDLTSAGGDARRVLATASRLGITHFKLGYWNYGKDPVEDILKRVRPQVRALAELAAENKIQAGWHNHSGTQVGASIWDTQMLIENLDPRWIGFFFDTSHAAAEGAVSGWNVGLRLALPRLKMVSAKDHQWEKTGKEWRRYTCPLGEGAVDLSAMFSMIAASGFSGIVSLQMEYDTADPLAAVQHDAAYLRQLIATAYQAAL